jgi:hypothetical protein
MRGAQISLKIDDLVQHEERKGPQKRADSRRASGPPWQIHLAVWRFPVATARKIVLLRP